MPSGPSPQDTIAAAQALIDEVTRNLNDSEVLLRQHEQTVQEFSELYERERGENLRRHVQDQVHRAQMQPGLPAADVAVDPITHFSRQVWRRRNAV